MIDSGCPTRWPRQRFPRLTPVAGLRRRQRPGGRQRRVVDEAAGENLLEQRGLLRLQGDEAAEHVEEVDQVAGVLGEPMVGLDVAERRGRAAVADDRARAVALAIAEPLAQHVHARDVVGPHLGRHVVDIALADEQPALGGVVVHLVGQRLGRAGDGAALGDGRRLVLRQARRAGGPAGLRIGEALAVGVQPDHLAAERGGLGEQLGVGGDAARAGRAARGPSGSAP